MEKSKKFAVLVKQLHQYSRRFIIEADSAVTARVIVKKYISDLPIDERRGTYDGSRIVFHIAKESAAKSMIPWYMNPVVVIDEDKESTTEVILEETDLQKAVAEIVKHLRLNQGMTVRDLATQADLAAQTIWELEQAESGVRFFNLVKIAHAFHQSPDELVRTIVREWESIAKLSPD